MTSLRFGRITCIDHFNGTFEIREENYPNSFLSARDCSSVFEGLNGGTSLAGKRPKTLYKVKRKQRVVFETDGARFATAWAPLKKFNLAKRSQDGGELASVKIGRKTYVGSKDRVANLIRRLAPKGGAHMSIFSRRHSLAF